MKKILIISLFSLLFFCKLITGGEVDKKLHTKCLYPTIYIGNTSESGFGSGVIVRSDKINDDLYKNVFISCGHLVDKNTCDYIVKQYIYEDWSTIKDVKLYPAVFFAYNTEIDISVGVFYSNKEMPTATLDFDPQIYIGNDVFRIGCGLGDEPRLDYGKLTYYKKNTKPVIRTSVMTVPGDSGSPLFHEYKVIGITVSIRTFRNLPVFGISYSVPMSRFKHFSQDNNNNINFVWDNSKKIPNFPFYYLEFKQYEIDKK